jgi:hypothetical protein
MSILDRGFTDLEALILEKLKYGIADVVHHYTSSASLRKIGWRQMAAKTPPRQQNAA